MLWTLLFLDWSIPTFSESWRNPGFGEPTFHAKKTVCYRLQEQTKVHVLALALHKTCSKRAVAHTIWRFHWVRAAVVGTLQTLFMDALNEINCIFPWHHLSRAVCAFMRPPQYAGMTSCAWELLPNVFIVRCIQVRWTSVRTADVRHETSCFNRRKTVL